jgi:hypothetical protein
VKTQERLIAIEEIIRPRPLWLSNRIQVRPLFASNNDPL